MKRIFVTLLSIIGVIAVVAWQEIPPPVEGYWGSRAFRCMCGHKNLLHFENGQETYYGSVHNDIPIKLGAYTWDAERSYVVTDKNPDVKFYPGWLRFRSEDATGSVTTGYRELRPWYIRDVLSFFAAPTPEDKARRHVPWDSDKVVGTPLKILMLGEFVLEGMHTFPDTFDLEDAIIAAGGVTERARERLVTSGGGVYEINLNPSRDGLTFTPFNDSPALPPLREVRDIYIWEDKSGHFPSDWKSWSREEAVRRKQVDKAVR